MVRTSIWLAWLSLAAAGLMAQTGGTGAITGLVTDPAGAVVPAAEVKATNTRTGETRNTTSGAGGTYLLSLLPPGTYRVEVSKAGFKGLTFPAVEVNVTETEKLNARLDVGAVNERITITADAEQLQTTSSSLGRVTGERMVVELPLAARNFTQIIALNPGVSAEVNNATDLGRGNGGMSNFSTGGASVKDNNYQMDGVGTNDIQNSGTFSGGVAIPNPDTIQEFRVQTQHYDASYGRNAGANINVLTKGGSNTLHASLFEFFRNEKLNANDFFFNRGGQRRPLLRQNQFGGTVGGPIVKDKLFAFGSYQGTRQRNGVSTSCSSSFVMPALTDNRSRAALGQLFAGQRGSAGPAIAADGSNISAQAFALLNYKLPNGQYAIPSPQRVDPSQPFAVRGSSIYSLPCSFDENQFMANADYVPTARHRLAYRFFTARSDQATTLPPANLGGPTAPGWPVLNPQRFYNTNITHTFIATPRLVNELIVGFHRQNAFTNQSKPMKYSDIGVNAPPYDNNIPQILINGALTLGGNGQSLRNIQNHYIFQDKVSYTLGKHVLRMGGGIERTHNNQQQFHYRRA